MKSKCKSTILISFFVIIFTLIVVYFGTLQAEAMSIEGLFNTGVDNNNALLPDGATDPHYILYSSSDPSFPGPDAKIVNSNGYPIPPWLSNGPNSKWIAPSANEYLLNPQGNYTYRITFDLTGLSPNSAMIMGKWTTDNNGVDIRINGTSTGFTTPLEAFGTGFFPFNIKSGFIPGINTLDFVVYNAPAGGLQNPTGLRVELNGMASPVTSINLPTPTSTPAITTFPDTSKLFGDSGSFIKNYGSSFSPSSQQFLNDKQSVINSYLAKFSSNEAVKSSAAFWRDTFLNLGTGLGILSIHDKSSFALFAGKFGFNTFDKVLDQKIDWQARFLIDGLTGGASILTGPKYTVPLTIGGLFCDGFAFLYDQLANDPPDSDFMQVFQSPLSYTGPFNLPGVSTEMNRLLGLQFGSLYDTYYYLTGLTTSINRYSSALAAGDAISATIQLESFLTYLSLYDSAAIQTADLIKQIKQAMINEGFTDSIYNRQEIIDLQNQIRSDGLPNELIEYFKSLGLTDSDIATLSQNVLDFIPPDSLPGSLHSSLSDGSNLLLSASSTPQVPLPSTLLLLGSGLLSLAGWRSLRKS